MINTYQRLSFALFMNDPDKPGRRPDDRMSSWRPTLFILFNAMSVSPDQLSSFFFSPTYTYV